MVLSNVLNVIIPTINFSFYSILKYSILNAVCQHLSQANFSQANSSKTPIYIEQHTALCYLCEHCQKFYYAPISAHIEKDQLIGLRLTATIAYMKDACHCSFSTIRKFLRDIVGITISRGSKVLIDDLGKDFAGLLAVIISRPIANT